MNLHVRERLRATRFLHGAHELAGTLDRDHFAGRSDNFRKIDSRITRPGSDIEHAAALGDAGLLPAFQNHRAPDAMLQSESRQLLIVRPEDVIALRHLLIRSAS